MRIRGKILVLLLISYAQRARERMQTFFSNSTYHTISLQGVALEESGKTPETDTHQKNSNITIPLHFCFNSAP